MWWIGCGFWILSGHPQCLEHPSEHTHTPVEASGLMGNLYKQQLTVQKWLEPGTYALDPLDPKCHR